MSVGREELPALNLEAISKCQDHHRKQIAWHLLTSLFILSHGDNRSPHTRDIWTSLNLYGESGGGQDETWLGGDVPRGTE